MRPSTAHRRPVVRFPGLALLVVVALASCSSAPTGGGGTITVLAAASLAEAFESLAEEFEDRSGTDVHLATAGSQQLASQVLDGAPADVFASADRRQMARVVDAGLVEGSPSVLAHNELTIVVSQGNPRDVDGVEDLADPALAVVLAAPQVPAGAYARRLLDRAGVSVSPVSLEVSVRAVLSKVALGEADAGIVYTTDVVASDAAVERVEVPRERNVVVDYPVAVLAEAANPAGAAAFVAFLRSDETAEVLSRAGFPVRGGA